MPLPNSTDKEAVEAFLKPLTSEDIRLFAERHKLDVSLLTNAPSSAQITLFKGEQPKEQTPLTRGIIAKNCGHIQGLPPSGKIDVTKLFPELAKKTPCQIVDALRCKFLKDPTASMGLLLQRVMNQYTSSGASNGHLAKEIEKAKAAFHKHSPSGGTDDIWYTAWVNAGYTGGSMFQDLPPGYLNCGYYYVGDSMNDKISSLKCGCSSDEVGGYVMLFQNANFYGNFQNYEIYTPGDTEDDISYVGDGFNDVTSSILIQRRFPNETDRIPLRDFIDMDTITGTVNNIAPGQLRSSGTPTLTWDLYPTGGNGEPNDPQKAFIYLIIPAQANTGQWFFGGWYDVQIRYWIYLYVDGNGQLQGYVNWWGYWVQGGLYTNGVASALQNQIPQHLDPVNALVSQAVTLANAGGPFSLIYYLPGMGGPAGNTNDGVSIIAAKQSSD